MKIAVIAPQPFTDIRATPMETLRLSRILADAGHRVDVLTYPFGEAPDYPGVKVHRCHPVPLVTSVGIGLSPQKILLDVSLTAMSRRIVRRGTHDCVHAIEEGLFIGAYLARRADIPLVYDMDSVMTHEVQSHAVAGIPGVTRFARASERGAMRRASAILTISEHMAEHARRISPGSKVFVVPDIPLPSPDGVDPDRARLELPPWVTEGTKVVLYAGSFAGYQGLDMLIGAMARVCQARADAFLLIIGGGPWEIDRLRKHTESVGLKGRVFFTGKWPPERIPSFLSIADVLVSPRTRGVNPPAKVLTYMQSARPLVATDIPAHAALLAPDTAVLVCPDADGLSDGILWALENPSEATARASRAAEQVKMLTPEFHARQILDVYRAVQDEMPTSLGYRMAA